MSTLHNLIYRLNETPVRISASCVVTINKVILKFAWAGIRPRIPKSILNLKIGELTLQELKTFYEATIIKTVWYWGKKRQTDPRKRNENAAKGVKATQGSKENLFNKRGWSNWAAICKMGVEVFRHQSYTLHKNQLKIKIR